MAEENPPEYYRINAEEDRQLEEVEKKGKCSWIKLTVLALIIAVAIGFAIALIVIFVGRGSGIPRGYNAFVVQESVNLRHSYFAHIQKVREVETPVSHAKENNTEFDDVDFQIWMMNGRTFRFSYTPQQHQLGDQKRWTVPSNLVERTTCDKSMRLSFGGFRVDEAPFGFSLRNPTHRNTLWLSSENRNLVMTDNYMEVGFELDSHEIFGWGERTRDFMLEEGEYSIWPTGIEKDVDPGEMGFNTFGDHPFILARLKDKTYVGMFFKNSNAKVLKYDKYSRGKSVVNFVTTGGILDVFAFVGDTAEQVLRLFHQTIGKPQLPPLWALGFQQGSKSYTNDQLAQQSVEKYKEAEIHLESLLIDENFMDDYRPFNIDTINFSKLKRLASTLHGNQQRLALSMHACIPVYNTNGKIYSYFTKGKEYFIRSNKTTTDFGGDVLIGDFLPGKCAYLDYHSPFAYAFIGGALTDLWAQTNYDGLQLNFNEIYQNWDGECPVNPEDMEKLENRFADLPFDPLGGAHTLDERAISLDALFTKERDEQRDSRVNFNNQGIYGTQMMNTQQSYLQFATDSPLLNKRSFIISRSTFSGAGQHGGHWLGDNNNTWEDMRHSISGILNFNLFGIPLTGANIWGTRGEMNEELCARWFQLGAMYPYARSYYDDTFGTREAWALTGKYQHAAKLALDVRMALLRYYYTTMFEASKFGGSFWRPLFFEFPEDDGALDDIEHTFMLGRALKITPILKPESESSTVSSYFPPNSRFLQFGNYAVIQTGRDGENREFDSVMRDESTNNKKRSITDILFPNNDSGSSNDIEQPEIPLIHMREGTIIPFQEIEPAITSEELVKNKPTNIFIFPDENLNAQGTLYVDNDGIDLNTIQNRLYQYYRITSSEGMIRFAQLDGIDQGGELDSNQVILNITIAGTPAYSDTTFACMFDENMDSFPIDFTFDTERNNLYLFAKDAEKQMDLRSLRGIQFGNSEADKSFCDPHYTVKTIQVQSDGENAGKVMRVDVTSKSGNLRNFHVDFNLMKDNLINIDFIPDDEEKTFEIPSLVLNKTIYPFTTSEAEKNIISFVKVAEEGQEFFFEIHAFDDPSQVLFSTKDRRMVFTRYFKSMNALVDSNHRVFGIGERLGTFWRSEGRYTVWNRGGKQIFDDGQNPGNNLYGSHPVYFSQRKSGNQWIGVYEHNSGPQEFDIVYGDNGAEITNIKTSGRTNLFIMLNEDIDSVVKNFYNLIGRPTLQPKWAFGWHQSRFGYNTTQALRDVFDGYRDKNLPLDAIWSDVDIYDDFRTFDFEEEFFEGVEDFLNEIKEKGVKYVPIVGSGIAAGNSKAYKDGDLREVFARSPANNKEWLIGRNTPGDVVFPSMFHEKTERYWEIQMDRLRESLPLDGVWLDMNEITSQCDAYCYNDQRAQNSIDSRLFYWPGGRDLEEGTISIDVVHEGDVSELDAHSLFGIMQQKMTHEYFMNNDKRPFVISRSTFTGAGKYGGHWLGDNESNQIHMRYSLHNVLLFNSFGVPFVGADVCGFNLNVSHTTCTKWYKVASIYPFARNHNNINTIAQEPYQSIFDLAMEDDEEVISRDVIKRAMMIRYGLHNYMYTQFHKSTTDGTMPIKPLFFNYPGESEAYDHIHNNILVGDAVKASPDTEVVGESTFYFPDGDGDWCPIWGDINPECIRGGTTIQIDVPENETLIHIASSHIIPLQLSRPEALMNSDDIHSLADLENELTDLAVFINRNNIATGDVRFDDGETTDFTQYDEITFNAERSNPVFGGASINITFSVTHSSLDGDVPNNQRLGEVVLYNANSLGMRSAEGTLTDINGGTFNLKVEYDEKLDISRLSYESDASIPLKEVKEIFFETA